VAVKEHINSSCFSAVSFIASLLSGRRHGALVLPCCCRRLDISGAINIIRQVLADEQQRQQSQQLHLQHSSSSSKSGSRSIHDSCGGSKPALLLRAFLEVSSIVPTNGSLAILNQGYSIGELQW
jgi:hypothetical protein